VHTSVIPATQETEDEDCGSRSVLVKQVRSYWKSKLKTKGLGGIAQVRPQSPKLQNKQANKQTNKQTIMKLSE
jgi:hypothetical protein